MSTFRFHSRWREELVCSGPGGRFCLEHPMGGPVLDAYLPTAEAWAQRAPEWARDAWPVLKAELEAWCAENKVRLFIDETAPIYPAA